MPRLSAQTHHLDVLLAGVRVMVLAIALALVAEAAAAQSRLFDSHVHLWNGEESLRAYEEQLKVAQLEAVGIGGMWFGGPNQALAGRQAMRNVGIDHILLGSDYPRYSLEQNVSALGRLALDETEKVKIQYENARNLFGLR